MFHFRASLRSLPSELIEEIIIVSALLGDVRAPSTLAQTCRAFRTLIYHQAHKHLWREMFLVLYDDPRPSHEVRAHGRVPQQLRLSPSIKGKGKSKNCVAFRDFPWEHEYKMRVWTESFILERTRPRLSGSSSPGARSDLPSTDAQLYTILETLLRVILTAVPLPYDVLASMTSHCPPRSQVHPHPFLSPVLIVAHTHPTLGHGSRNIRWLAHVLAHGLPRALLAPLNLFDENGQIDVQKRPVQWHGLLAKFVAQVGLMTPYNDDRTDDDKHVTPEPRRNPEVTHDDLSDDDSDFEPLSESDDSEESSGESVDSEYLSRATVISATPSQESVRRLARLRVYNMAYLHPSRAFGPFLPLETHSTNLGCGAVDEAEHRPVNHNPMRHSSPSIAALLVPPIPETDSKSYLTDGIDLSHLPNHNADDNEDETAGDASAVAEPTGPLFFRLFPVSLTPDSPTGGGLVPDPLRSPMSATHISGTRRMYNPGVASDQAALEFDWAWIAAARRVIELNLRDLLRRNRHQGVLRALLSLEGLRSCSAPGFPASAPEPGVDLGEGEGGRTFKDGEGWDWAGVEGQWRCVALLS